MVERAKRRRRRVSYRLALVYSKFRGGEEPDPRCFEIRHDTEPWSVAEVTSEVEQALENAKRAAADAEQVKVDQAVKALVAALPLPKNPDAMDLLITLGFGRNAARRLIDQRAGQDWLQTGTGTKTDSFFLRAVAGEDAARKSF